MNLRTNIQYLKGIGPAKAVLLGKLGIYTLGDLLEHYPRQYEDRTQFKLIKDLQDGQLQTFVAVIVGGDEKRPRRGLTITRIYVRDDGGQAELIWFNQPYKKRECKAGKIIVISGKVQHRFGTIQIQNPDIEDYDQQESNTMGKVLPVYPASENIKQGFLRNLIQQVLDNYSYLIEENLPECIKQKYNLADRINAFKNVHFPENMEILSVARKRLVFEELYLLQCGLAYLRKINKCHCQGIKHTFDGKLVKQLESNLSFKLTDDQQSVLQEIKADMEDVTPMQRLVQGDVGSGKTVLAAIALAKTVENGFQGAMMAPTEILSEQHYHTLAKMMSPLGVKLALLTGSLAKSAKSAVLKGLKDGLIDIVIGTHALLQDTVEFKNLGLVVTDEQHRFGVRQRAVLQAKGQMPDVLVMTATPIPRTMALTVYGDLDVSLIRQLPAGRKPIITKQYGTHRRADVYRGVVREIERGRQAYIVCPLVEESDKIDAQSAVDMYQMLTNSHFKNISCGIVHGKMKQSEKDEVMSSFYQGKTKILIATTVIEVGVNVPNATVMVIEDADRFGLAQLHQLRGRIGRGEYQSYCMLLSDSKSEETKERLSLMTQYADGFVLAEKDLELRGPGQFFGTKQHGLPDLKIANIIQDIDILLQARQAAEYTVSNSELLENMKKALQERFKDQFNMIFCN